jgi:hypothetical protein
MPEIAAANNLTIHTDEQRWSLLNGRTDEAIPIVEATEDGLAFQPAFGRARRLPSDGRLPISAIETVVCGWAGEDSSWHLGVLVSPEIAQERGSRWCGFARWPDQERDQAERAGAALAAALSKPFRFIPAPHTQPAVPDAAEEVEEAEEELEQEEYEAGVTVRSDALGMATVPTLPPLRPMPLPINLDEWIVQEHPQGMIWQHSSRWRTRTVLYGVFSLGLAVLFGALSLGAKLSPYAPVQPEWLPFVGLAIAMIMFVIGVGQILTAARALSVMIDNRQKMVRLMRGPRRVALQSPYEGIQYVLVSHVINRRESLGKSDMDQPDMVAYERIWPEIWVHLYSPRRGFINVCYLDSIEGRAIVGFSEDLEKPKNRPKRDPIFEQRRPLNLAEIDTSAHHAALIMAEMIGVPAYVEER